MKTEYIPKEIEIIVQTELYKNKAFSLKNIKNKIKYYCLSMFPYPSGKLHMGHIRNYTIGDVITRYKKMLGYHVFNPIGWDAFGIPAENAARDNNISPYIWTKKNIDCMKTQLKSLGFDFDWTREINTSDHKYYKWEQMFFIKLYESGLVYRKNAFVNWDPIDKTVLANEQVVDGKGWRSNVLIERKKISQWYINITRYADLLFDDLKKLINWPLKVKEMQKNWINKKLGFYIHFNIFQTKYSFSVFKENLFNFNDIIFIKMSCEDDLFEKIKNDICTSKLNDVYYITVENPFNKTEIKIFFHDNIKLCIEIFNLITNSNLNENELICVDEFNNSKFFILKNKHFLVNKFSTLFFKLNDADSNIILFKILKKRNSIKIAYNYKLQDWCVSRQRYWGTPIPIIYCNKCGITTENIKSLPIKLPKIRKKNYINIELIYNKKFLTCVCNKCNKNATRESDTFDTFFESSWYYTKYICYKKNLNTKDLNMWLPVDQYIGGIEHANLHLIYARFFCKVMKDFEIISCDEPFNRLLTQGMILMGGSKMSKSKGNTVNQDFLISKYGADALRLFVMFLAPPEQSFEWNDNGILGCKKFLDKIWRMSFEYIHFSYEYNISQILKDLNAKQHNFINSYNYIIDNLKNNIENRMVFNVVVSDLMKLGNLLNNFMYNDDIDKYLFFKILKNLIILLSPFAPHISYYIWTFMFKVNTDLAHEKFPAKIIIENNSEENMNIALYINGKFKKMLSFKNNLNKESIIKLLTTNEILKQFFINKKITNIIYKEKKLINILLE